MRPIAGRRGGSVSAWALLSTSPPQGVLSYLFQPVLLSLRQGFRIAGAGFALGEPGKKFRQFLALGSPRVEQVFPGLSVFRFYRYPGVGDAIFKIWAGPSQVQVERNPPGGVDFTLPVEGRDMGNGERFRTLFKGFPDFLEINVCGKRSD